MKGRERERAAQGTARGTAFKGENQIRQVWLPFPKITEVTDQGTDAEAELRETEGGDEQGNCT